MTPEARTKYLIKKVLDKYSTNIYYYMPVPGGFGAATLDYLGFYFGHGFAIEAKAPGKRPTPRQMLTIGHMFRSGARVFVVDGTDDTDTVADLEQWFITITMEARHDVRQTDEPVSEVA
jgi:hypothetical protein